MMNAFKKQEIDGLTSEFYKMLSADLDPFCLMYLWRALAMKNFLSDYINPKAPVRCLN